MSKNIFEENSKINLFDQLNFNAKGSHESDHKVNKKDNCNKELIKEVFETSNKSKKHVSINDPNSSPPAMYKIALRLKKLTETTIKRSTIDTNETPIQNTKNNHEPIFKARNSELEDFQTKSLILPAAEETDFELELENSNCIGL